MTHAPPPTSSEGTSADEAAPILVVDDRPEKLLALKAVLSDLGQEIVTAGSGQDALRVLLRRDFAVILLDVNMPQMDGFETAALVRQRARSEHTPIIFVTGVDADEPAIERGYSLGAVDFIFAPVVATVLRAKVSVFIDLFRKTRQVERQAVWLREEAERRAERLETRLRGLLDRLEVGVFRSTLDGRIVEANPAFLKLMGVASLEEGDPLLLEALPAAREREESGPPAGDYRDARLRRPDGSTVWVSLSRTLTADAEGRPHIEGLVADITGRKQAEEELARKAEELARTNADLERFAYIASHDLQEPLRMIRAYGDLLVTRYSDHLDEKARSYLQFAVDGAARMQTLIQDLLSYSRTRSHETRTAPAPLDELLDRALFNLRTAIEESGAVIERSPLPVVEVDAVLVVQLLQNLVGNALKFHGDDPPRVRVEAQRRGDEWRFSVADNGIGIPTQFQDKVFGMFRRLHGRGRYPGTGMGLAICRNIVERHGGRIWVEAAPGGGACFCFTLNAPPLEDDEPAPAEDSETAREPVA